MSFFNPLYVAHLKKIACLTLNILGLLFCAAAYGDPLKKLLYKTVSFELALQDKPERFQVGWAEHKATNLSQTYGTIISIHGTPGGWGAWSDLIQESRIAQHFDVLAIDRPGWGESQASDGRVLPAFSDQQRILSAWLDELGPLRKPVIVMGHSWGGPLAAYMAAKEPERIDKLMVIAAPFSPALSKPRWYNRWAKTAVVRALIGRSMRRSNIEMLPLYKQLDIVQEFWPKITQPTLIVQGDRDFLVHSDNALFFKNKLSTKDVVLMSFPSEGHFLPFNKPELLVDGLVTMLGAPSVELCCARLK